MAKGLPKFYMLQTSISRNGANQFRLFRPTNCVVVLSLPEYSAQPNDCWSCDRRWPEQQQTSQKPLYNIISLRYFVCMCMTRTSETPYVIYFVFAWKVLKLDAFLSYERNKNEVRLTQEIASGAHFQWASPIYPPLQVLLAQRTVIFHSLRRATRFG